MLFRRITEHVKAQNWTAVALDFGIVVVGVVIGIQVANWNDARLERAREQASLIRLLEEAENAVAYIDRERQTMAGRVESMHALMRLVSSDKPLSEDLAAAEEGYISLEFFPAITPVRTVYDELTSAGQMQSIRSAAVRDAVALYYADLGWFENQLDYFRTFSVAGGYYVPVAGRAFVQYRYDPDSPVGRDATFDWEAMRADAEFITLLVSKLRNQIVMHGNRTELLEGAQFMCDALAREIGRPCAPRLGDGSQD